MPRTEFAALQGGRDALMVSSLPVAVDAGRRGSLIAGHAITHGRMVGYCNDLLVEMLDIRGQVMTATLVSSPAARAG